MGVGRFENGRDQEGSGFAFYNFCACVCASNFCGGGVKTSKYNVPRTVLSVDKDF